MRQIPISASKRADLMSVIKSGLIPDDYANFYTKFPVSIGVDLEFTPKNSDDD